MEKQELINLTNIIYRLTLFFPKKEPLRYKIRELADDILAKHLTKQEIVKDLEVLDVFFEVAKAQNWVKLDELLEIQKEYGNLKQEIERTQSEEKLNSQNLWLQPQTTKQRPEVRVRDTQGFRAVTMQERQERILAFLRENGRAQVWQIKEILPEVTKRTLRRDFEALLKQDLIERIGERNNTFYQIKKLESNNE